MKFPGRRKSKHYFPVVEESRPSLAQEARPHYASYIVGIDQLLVDVEIEIEEQALKDLGLMKGESQIVPAQNALELYQDYKKAGKVRGEFAGGAIGNTLHNYSTLSDSPSVALGTICSQISVGDYAFKYICHTSSKVDFSYLLPVDGPMAMAMCFITPDGERTFGICKGIMNLLTPEAVPPKVIENSAALLVSTFLFRDDKAPLFKAATKALQIAKEAGIPIIMTLGTSSLVKEKKEFFREIIRDYVNVLAMNEAEAEALVGVTDPLKALEATLEITDLVLLTVGREGLYMGGHVDVEYARETKDAIHSKSIAEYNKYEYSRGMKKADCLQSMKIYSHINPFLGGPREITNTNGAGDAALASILHDIAANNYHRQLVPTSPKHQRPFLTYSSLHQMCKYANRVSFEVLSQNSPRLFKGLPEREDSLEEAYWAK